MAHKEKRHPHSTPVLIRAIIDNSQGKEKNLTEDDKEALKDFWEHNNGVSQQEILYNLSVGHFPHLYGDWAAPSKENTQPLWKVLNEARTQGEVRIIEPDEIAMEFTGMVIDGEFNAPKNIIKKKVIAEFPDLRGDAYEDIREQQTANAAYTALAVNNLHILAEALEKAREALRKLDLIDKTFTAEGAIDAVNEALNRIS